MKTKKKKRSSELAPEFTEELLNALGSEEAEQLLAELDVGEADSASEDGSGDDGGEDGDDHSQSASEASEPEDSEGDTNPPDEGDSDRLCASLGLHQQNWMFWRLSDNAYAGKIYELELNGKLALKAVCGNKSHTHATGPSLPHAACQQLAPSSQHLQKPKAPIWAPSNQYL